MLKEKWQWKKAIASVLGAFVLVGGASGLTSCEFPGGEQEVEQGDDEQEVEQGDDEEDGDDDD